MVLEELPSDPDPYSPPPDPFQPSPTSPDLSLDLSTLPQPIPLSQLWGFTASHTRNRILLQINLISSNLHRPLRPDEISAISYHSARGERYASMGVPLGVVAGAYRARATRAEGRFPFQNIFFAGRKPPFAIDGEVLSFAGRELLRGPQVGKALESVRGGLYIAIGYWVGGFLMKNYGASVASVGTMADSRMGDLRTALQKNLRQRQGAARPRAPTTEVGGGAPPRRDPMVGQGQQSSWRNQRSANQGDDASPTAGTEDFFGGPPAPTEPQPPSPEQRPQPQYRRTPFPPRNPSSSSSSSEQSPQPSDFTSDYFPSSSSTDSSSPSTNPNTYSSAEAGGESAWERIRRENASGGTPAMKGQTGGDSFSFSSTEEERSYARAEAQKQFDERVERERRGEDFGGRRGGGGERRRG